MMVHLVVFLVFLVFLMLAGCSIGAPSHVPATGAPAAPLGPPGLAEAQALVANASRAYKVDPPALMVGAHAGDATFGAVYRRGVIIFTARSLAGPGRDVITAHELAHYVLRHEHPTMRTQEEKEHQANIEAVRILMAGKGITEEQAARAMLEFLGGLRRSVERGGAVARGHAHPCEEIHAVVVAYPAQRGWSKTFECAGRR
jgi:hypothetical protein